MITFDVITLGIAVMDIIASSADRTLFDRDTTPIDEIVVCPGGDAANEAINLKKLGLSVALSCRLGHDSMGGLFLSTMNSHGVDTSHTVISPVSRTSTSIVIVSANGDRNIICMRGNNYDFCFSDIDLNFIENAKALCIGSFFGCPRLEEDGGLLKVLKHAKSRNIITFADMASDKKSQKLKGIERFLPYTDYFLPSENESKNLTGIGDCAQAARVYKDAGAKNVVIKLGGRGAYASMEGFEGYINPFSIAPKDTTGAGDSFCAGLIYGILKGLGAEKTLGAASACGAYNSLYMGANTSPLSETVLFDFIASTPKIKIY